MGGYKILPLLDLVMSNVLVLSSNIQRPDNLQMCDLPATWFTKYEYLQICMTLSNAGTPYTLLSSSTAP